LYALFCSTNTLLYLFDEFCLGICCSFQIASPSSGEVRHDIRDEQFSGLRVVPSIGIEQQVAAGVLVLPDQVDEDRILDGPGTSSAAQSTSSGSTRPLPPSAGCGLPAAAGIPSRIASILELTGPDAERHSSPADQIDARRDLGEMRGIAITDRGAKGGETDAGGNGG
jgi:hypothetical protein